MESGKGQRDNPTHIKGQHQATLRPINSNCASRTSGSTLSLRNREWSERENRKREWERQREGEDREEERTPVDHFFLAIVLRHRNAGAMNPSTGAQAYVVL